MAQVPSDARGDFFMVECLGDSLRRLRARGIYRDVCLIAERRSNHADPDS